MAWWSMSSFSLDSPATDVLVDDDITSAPQTVNPQLVAVERGMATSRQLLKI
ncbi:transcription-repair coupling factor [Cutibacterium acnes JCM 18920]|nr:transcription-repair coupling factor [Cutibacterium acnes JCM 18920]